MDQRLLYIFLISVRNTGCHTDDVEHGCKYTLHNPKIIQNYMLRSEVLQSWKFSSTRYLFRMEEIRRLRRVSGDLSVDHNGCGACEYDEFLFLQINIISLE